VFSALKISIPNKKNRGKCHSEVPIARLFMLNILE